MNKTLLYASVFGAKVAEKVPRLEVVNNRLETMVLPPIPFIGKMNEIEQASKSYSPTMEYNKPTPSNIDGHFFPLTFRRRKTLKPGEPAEQWFTFPYEPLVSIDGHNIIVRKAPAKAPNFIGTVKERFAQDDYEIKITGSLIGPQLFGTAESAFPRAEFERLRDYCISPQGIEVKCEPLQLLGINYLVVEDFSFPFTNGENVQAYELKCYSDFSSELLLEID